MNVDVEKIEKIYDTEGKFVQINNDPICYHLNHPDSKKLYISSGIHGNESSGPIALNQFVNYPGMFDGVDTTIIPILNRYGYAHNQRHNQNDKDLNRDYRSARQKETKKHLELIQDKKYDLAMCLHESSKATGCFIYKPNRNKRMDVMEEILIAMSRVMPVDNRHSEWQVKIERGILKDTKYKEQHWTEAVYFSHNDIPAFTIEVPSAAPLQQRIVTFQAAILKAVELLNENII